LTSLTSIGIDLGGTTIKGGAVNEGRIVAREETTTPQSEDACIEAIASIARNLASKSTNQRIGLGVPGVINPDGDSVAGTPNLSFLAGKPLASRVSEILGAPVLMGNDASLAALGEAKHGAGNSHPDFLLVTLGTGVGGGLILGNKLHTGPGMAGEIGHLQVGHERICACGAQGCLEAVLGAAPIIENLKECGVTSSSLPEASQLARSGNADAVKAFANAGKYLGEALAQVSLLLDIRVFLFAGGVSAAIDLLAPSALAILEKRAFGRKAQDFLIARSTLGEDAGIFGAAELALQNT